LEEFLGEQGLNELAVSQRQHIFVNKKHVEERFKALEVLNIIKDLPQLPQELLLVNMMLSRTEAYIILHDN
jgi:hypothetical protein